jgi:hypothetical protein
LSAHSVDELLSADEAFIKALAIVRVEDAERAEFERVFTEAVKSLVAERNTDRIKIADLLKLIVGWIVHRRPGNERADLVEIAQDAASALWQPEEVNRMIRTYADELLEEGEARGIAKGEASGEAKGAVREAREVIVRVGKKWLGAVDPTVDAALNAVSDIERLRRFQDRLIFEATVTSWAELLETP